jgi:serine/threonine-protein kinase
MTTNPSTPVSASELIGQFVGNYKIMRLLGEGGMGMVFEAVHGSVGGQAAIKILRPEVAKRHDIITRFFNEARAANSISHPGIVHIYDCGYTASGIAYLTMEFLAGSSLRARMEASPRLPSSDALRIARQIAAALQAAHQRNVIHRDLKPDNVMLVPDADLPGGERVKVLDFGIAKMADTLAAEPLQTRSDMLMGTPTYMSPEQCRGGKHVTAKSDVYSLGIILYQMLAGKPPFVGDSIGELIAMHLADEPPKLLSVAPYLDPQLALLVHSMLDKNASSRPNMAEACRALHDVLNALSTRATVPQPIAAPRGVDSAYLQTIDQPEIRESTKKLAFSLLVQQAAPNPAPSRAAALPVSAAPALPATQKYAAVGRTITGMASQVVQRKKHRSPIWLGLGCGLAVVAMMSGVGWLKTHLPQPASMRQPAKTSASSAVMMAERTKTDSLLRPTEPVKPFAPAQVLRTSESKPAEPAKDRAPLRAHEVPKGRKQEPAVHPTPDCLPAKTKDSRCPPSGSLNRPEPPAAKAESLEVKASEGGSPELKDPFNPPRGKAVAGSQASSPTTPKLGRINNPPSSRSKDNVNEMVPET